MVIGLTYSKITSREELRARLCDPYRIVHTTLYVRCSHLAFQTKVSTL